MTDQADRARTAAYADLVSALAGARRDPASERFDLELAAAEAAGTVDPVTARTLRWWQRESVRAVEDHLGAVLPDVLNRLDAAEREAVATVAASADSWATASGSTTAEPPPRGDGPDDPGGVRRSTTTPSPGSPSGGAAAPGDPSAPYLRPVDTASPGGAEGAEGSVRLGFAPSSTTPPGARAAQESVTGGAPPRRLLVAGLTVLTDGDHSPSTRSRTAHGDAPGATG